jgi:hypothetical protein
MERKSSSRGIGSVVIAIYAIFSLSATVRALYQLTRKFDEAPLAYSLSLLAGLIYIVATYALITRKYGLAKQTLYFELFGVALVGLLSLLIPELFAHPSVWSYFGMGYGFIPLVLPIFGLWWLRRSKNA